MLILDKSTETQVRKRRMIQHKQTYFLKILNFELVEVLQVQEDV